MTLLKKKMLSAAVGLVALVGFGIGANAQEALKLPDHGMDLSAIETVAEIAAKLPEDYRARGSINIGSTSSNLPAQIVTENGDLIGLAVDMYRGAAKVLGMEAKFEVITFDGMLPGVESGRYDVGTAGDSIEREKVIDSISLYNNGLAILARTENPTEIKDWPDLCGKSVGAAKASLAARYLGDYSEKLCVAEGKAPIEVSLYSDAAGTSLAVVSRQNEFGLQETIVGMAFAGRNPDVLKVVYNVPLGTSGAVIKKGNDAFRDAFHEALLHLVKIGFYEEAMKFYGIPDLMLPELPLNLAGQAK